MQKYNVKCTNKEILGLCIYSNMFSVHFLSFLNNFCFMFKFYNTAKVYLISMLDHFPLPRPFLLP